MIFIDKETIEKQLPYSGLIAALHKMLIVPYTMPVRHHHFYENSEEQENTLILMPAWNREYMGIKQVIVAPNNHTKGLPAIYATYTLIDALTGVPLAQMDASGLTARRTACASALAASFLAREDTRSLLVVGGGKVAEHLIHAHAAVRNYDRVMIWMRNKEKGVQFVQEQVKHGVKVDLVQDLEAAVRQADVISTATLSRTPLIRGEWVQPGTHLDLIGAHTPKSREVDDDAIKKSSIFVDSREGALHETGEMAIPIANGVLDPQTIKADIVELCKKAHVGRRNENEITLFKSAGLAIEDLAAALLVYQSISDNHQ
ncbi:ornithine cyclodeaminase family protein [Sphingobacterium gobiense]|uniref:Ornithine cyclodeaminase family protein n=1 Tax=Sphingobacterium gobiense TaxID=1382456 RepID=A0A2S9JVJ5_9SPHI|nr:ornithine cyclodeaminase family protein [Sphingobacterium gobiense]PRD57294.1 ornithine cyclodeaminase family protein [Sphingobacterium gobiense]